MSIKPSQHGNVLSCFSSISTTDLLLNIPGKHFVHIDHSDTSKEKNFIELSRNAPTAKELLIALVNAGFTLYKMQEGISSFVHDQRLRGLWSLCREGALTDHNGVLFNLSLPERGTARRLLVIFSSISGKMYQASLLRHYEQNYKSAAKHIIENTAILRIADLGGVCGSFYLNTIYLPKNEANIRSLLRHSVSLAGVAEDDVVLFGTSKGGTAAAYYGLDLNWKFVAVDPIVSDEHYIHQHNDPHFVQGVFPLSKQEKFLQLLEKRVSKNQTSPKNNVVVYSSRSPQFRYINDILLQNDAEDISYINCVDSRIKNHPDVASVTMQVWQTALNQALLGIPCIARRLTIYQDIDDTKLSVTRSAIKGPVD